MLSSWRVAIMASLAERPRSLCTAGATVNALGLGSKPSSSATSAAFSYSTTWLILAKMLCLIRPRIISLGVACNSSARSLTTICGGIETGPVGFSLTAAARRSCERWAGVVVGLPPVRPPPECPWLPWRVVEGRDELLGRDVPFCELPPPLFVLGIGRDCVPEVDGYDVVVLL